MISHSGTFSADVKLWLHTSTGTHELGHLGPDFALLATPQIIDSSAAEIETIIDGISTRWKIQITSPFTEASRRFKFEAV